MDVAGVLDSMHRVADYWQGLFHTVDIKL